MKKFFAAMLAAVMIITIFSACAKSGNSSNDSSDKLKIISTIFPSYDFARQVGGENVNVTMLLKPGTESHTYDPTPQDIIKIQDCDLFIYVGGESDEWVNDILNSNDRKPKKIIALMDCVDKVEEEIVEGMEEDGEDEEGEGDTIEYDEHVWTSPVNASKISNKIADALKELDPKNEKNYEKNRLSYSRELSALDSSFKKTVDNSERKLIVFGDRFPFRYLADEYGLSYYAAFPGCSSETEPSASTISFLINKVKEKNIPVVFTIEFSNGKVADTICEDTGAKKLELHSCHNVTQDEFDNGVTYVSLMQQNVKNLGEALS